ncbi:hypothetical protein [Micromonospora sp. NPDC005979]|uniref:hypothetical protein n=1 Tax=Micromonospora sp. NPDC005979 TaxID=3156726 RepID=UPI0033A7BCD4
MASLLAVIGADGTSTPDLTTLPGAVHGAIGDLWDRRDGRILCFVYIAGLLHFQHRLALRMACSPQYVAVNNKTK